MKPIIQSFSRLADNLINFVVNTITSKKELNEIINQSGKNPKPSGLKKWVEKWSVLGTPNKDYYRVLSKYIGENIDIVPDNLCHNIIIPILNPKRYISTYADKNLFDKFLRRKDGTTLTPPTLLRCINGGLLDKNYEEIDDKQAMHVLSEESSIIVKPSIDGSSGKGIMFFDKNGNDWEERDSGDKLTIQLLFDKVGTDFIIQRTMQQSSFMSKLCNTSVNTIRIAVYRSVNDNKCHTLRTIIRIGKKGSLVDNAHAGGMFVGIDENGSLGKYCCNQFGQITKVFNGIDFDTNDLIIPNFVEVKKFAEEVGSCIPHLRLLALDIMLDKKNKPVLIEYNVKAFAPWLFQFTSGTAFGEYTDEIIDYCKKNRKEATRIFISF